MAAVMALYDSFPEILERLLIERCAGRFHAAARTALEQKNVFLSAQGTRDYLPGLRIACLCQSKRFELGSHFQSNRLNWVVHWGSYHNKSGAPAEVCDLNHS